MDNRTEKRIMTGQRKMTVKGHGDNHHIARDGGDEVVRMMMKRRSRRGEDQREKQQSRRSSSSRNVGRTYIMPGSMRARKSSRSCTRLPRWRLCLQL